MLAHGSIRVLAPAVDAPLGSKAAVGLDDLVGRDAGAALEAVDVLGEEVAEEAAAGEEGDEGVGDGGVEFARVELAREDVEGFGVLAEVGDVEDGFGVGEVEAGEVGVQAGAWGSKVGDW